MTKADAGSRLVNWLLWFQGGPINTLGSMFVDVHRKMRIRERAVRKEGRGPLISKTRPIKYRSGIVLRPASRPILHVSTTSRSTMFDTYTERIRRHSEHTQMYGALRERNWSSLHALRNVFEQLARIGCRRLEHDPMGTGQKYHVGCIMSLALLHIHLLSFLYPVIM